VGKTIEGTYLLNLPASVRRNLAGLTDFRGRDSSPVFWPYALTVIAVLVVVPSIAMQVVLVPLVTAQPSLQPTSFLPFYFGWLALIAVLLAAAVSRRLRDANQSALWGLWPLILAALNGVFIQQAFTAEDIPNAWFFGTFGANLLTLILLIVLIVKLNGLTAPVSAAGPE
jgi:uncharacterized membrane protein YhaH (DUF805 family)